VGTRGKTDGELIKTILSIIFNYFQDRPIDIVAGMFFVKGKSIKKSIFKMQPDV